MRLSVVVATRDNSAEVAACLESLAPQIGGDVEVLLADASRPGTIQPIQRVFGWVRPVRAPVGSGLAELRAAGLANASGSVVAFTDACCRVGAGWVDGLRAAPWQAYSAVGGMVLPPPRLSPTDWAAFLTEYAPYLPPRAPAESRDLPGNNVAFRRDALERAGLVGAPEFWKSFALRRLLSRGERGWFEPSLVVHHCRSIAAARWASMRYLHGRCFAANRGDAWPASWRVVRAALSPAVPLVLTARIARSVYSKRTYRSHLWRSLPLIFAFHAAWAWGESAGYLRGRGDACARLS